MTPRGAVHTGAVIVSALLAACEPPPSNPAATQLAPAQSEPLDSAFLLHPIPQHRLRRLCDDTGPGTAHCFIQVVDDLPPLTAQDVANPDVTPPGLNPGNIAAAYNLPATGGTGLTVGIVDAFDDPNAEADLAVYRAQWGLPPCTTANGCFKKVNQRGVQGSYPPGNTGWGGEITLDLDAVSAACPNCNILLVEADSNTLGNLAAADDEAVALGASVVSNSFGGADETSLASHYAHAGIAVFASAGDHNYGVETPAAYPAVISIGGTSLVTSATPRGWSETVWGLSGGFGTGSGCSTLNPKPAWQTDPSCAKKMVADLSAVADPNTGLAIYDTFGSGGWGIAGGTSLSSPLVAAIFALTGHEGDDGSTAWSFSAPWYDVTTGSNGTCAPNNYFCTGEAGYDGPSGNGTPNGGVLIQAFTFATTGSPLTIPVNASGLLTFTTSLTAGSATSLDFSISGLPPGVTASFAPVSAAIGSPTNLTLSAGPSASGALGTYTLSPAAKGASRKVATPITLNLVTDIVWSGLTPQTLEATGAAGAPAAYAPSASQLGGQVMTVACVPVSGSTFPIATTTVTCTASWAGDVGTGTFAVTVRDTTPPVLALPGPQTKEATSSAGAVVTFATSATDLVDGARPVVCVPTSGATFAVGVTTVSCHSTDTHGNTGNGTITVTVTDTTAPALTLPPGVTAEATSAAGAAVSFPATASDLVDGSVAVICTPASGSSFPLGTTAVSCHATDAHGNTANGGFSVTVHDTTPPALTLPGPQTKEATSSAGAAVTFSASATDGVDGSVAVTCVPASGATFPLGATTVSCHATDAHGNTGNGTFTVTVTDTAPPSLTLPANITAEATGSAGRVVSFSATASDLVDGALAVTCVPASGSTFPLGVTTVSCHATDTHGNTSNGTFTVTVRDTTPPSLTLPANIAAEATGPSGAAVTFSATASDLVDGALTVTCAPASGSTFALGTATVSCHATDSHGNTGSGTFTVTVRDTTPPSLTLPANKTVEATSGGGAVVSFSATATDLVGGSRPVTCVPASGAMFPLGTTTVSCSASDAAGNAASGTFTVTVQDTTGPVLTLPSSSPTAEATGSSGAVVTFSVSATDAVDGARPVSCVPASGSTFAIGTTTVNCSSTDAGGHTSTGTFTVIVTDTTKPVLTLPAPPVVEATGPSGAAVTFSATANDTVDGPRPVSCVPPSGSTFAVGATAVTCTASDTHGNTATGTFTVTVHDTTPPSLTLPANQTAEATSGAGASVTFSASAGDLVDGARPVTCVPASGATFAVGTTSVSCSASDTHGNPVSGSFTVTVTDTTAPTLTLPSPLTLEATSGAGAAATFTATASDLVDGARPVTCVPASGSTFALGVTTVSCTATDAHNNTRTGTFTVTVTDTTAPVLTLPADMTLGLATPGGTVVSFSATATDLVDGALTVSCTPPSGSTFMVGTAAVNCSVTDAHGNPASGTFHITIKDSLPVLTLPAPAPAEATGPGGANVTFSATATDVVDGSVAVTCTPASGSTFPIGTTLVSCSATNSRAGTASGSFSVVVRDTTPPALTVPSPITAEATSAAGAVVMFSASASDVVDGMLAAACAPASGSTFALGTTTVSCSAMDAHGNHGSAMFTVTVRDTTAPQVTAPAPITAEATSPSGAAVTFMASASDGVDGPIAANCAPPSGSMFAVGTTSVTCSASDAHGNAGGAMFTVTVTDTTAPVLTVPSPITAEATSASGAAVTFTATAADLVDGALAPNCTPASGSTFPLGMTAVSCSVSDAHGNSASATFSVTVEDTTPPALTVPPEVTAEQTSAAGANVTFTATALDAVDGAVTPGCMPASGALFPAGDTAVTCSATDAHGNTAGATFTVTVHDTTAPQLTCPADVTAKASSGAGAVVGYPDPAATDAVSTPVFTYSAASGSAFAVGATSVTVTASDAAGNHASCTFTVSVTPPDMTMSMGPDAGMGVTAPRGCGCGSASDLAPLLLLASLLLIRRRAQ